MIHLKDSAAFQQHCMACDSDACGVHQCCLQRSCSWCTPHAELQAVTHVVYTSAALQAVARVVYTSAATSSGACGVHQRYAASSGACGVHQSCAVMIEAAAVARVVYTSAAL